MKIESARLARELHCRFDRKLIPLTTIARVAASHEIFPSRRASAGSWNDVIERQFSGGQHHPTVLAGIAIAQKDVFA